MTTDRKRLEGWKEIGPRMHVSPRTARRLVRQHRDLQALITMGLNGQVWAYADEIDPWVKAHEKTYAQHLDALEAGGPRPGPARALGDPVVEPQPQAA